MINVLFVCLGNICRSPMAEGILKDLIEQHELSNKIFVDSAGTAAYHLGELPDYRTRKVLENKGIKLNHKARQLTSGDFQKFHYILAADNSNLQNILSLKDATYDSCKALLIRQFDEEEPNGEVPDPYYGSMNSFEEVYDILERSLQSFLEHLRQEHNI